MVAKNSDEGPYNILIWFALEFTNKDLGEKDALVRSCALGPPHPHSGT